MKALTFLEYYQNEPKASLRDSYHKIVSQSFKPEMIAELFKDWYIDEENFFVNNNLGAISFEEINNTILFYPKSQEIKANILIFNMPTNLNDFISDCQRAGIDLEFKEEISKKF